METVGRLSRTATVSGGSGKRGPIELILRRYLVAAQGPLMVATDGSIYTHHTLGSSKESIMWPLAYPLGYDMQGI